MNKLTVENFDQLELCDVFDYYDLPLLFSCETKDENIWYLGCCIDCSMENKFSTWLYLKTTKEQVEELRKMKNENSESREKFTEIALAAPEKTIYFLKYFDGGLKKELSYISPTEIAKILN